eukprot:m.84961 g.84961  ORF g.84961 m.84961 type:complete len:140 (+) comp9613_c0_seq2:251-670(+)
MPVVYGSSHVSFLLLVFAAVVFTLVVLTLPLCCRDVPVMRAFSSRPIKEQPRPVQKRAPPPDDANDETLVYAEAEDPDDDKESWLDIVKDLQISPSEQTVQGAEANATNAASDSDGGTKKKSAGNKKGAKKKGGKKKKR